MLMDTRCVLPATRVPLYTGFLMMASTRVLSQEAFLATGRLPYPYMPSLR